jgi:hypothetical protein
LFPDNIHIVPNKCQCGMQQKLGAEKNRENNQTDSSESAAVHFIFCRQGQQILPFLMKQSQRIMHHGLILGFRFIGKTLNCEIGSLYRRLRKFTKQFFVDCNKFCALTQSITNREWRKKKNRVNAGLRAATRKQQRESKRYARGFNQKRLESISKSFAASGYLHYSRFLSALPALRGLNPHP